MNPQPPRERETGGWREQKSEREHELKASVEGTTQYPQCWSTTQSCEAEPNLTLTSKSFCLNTHHSPRRGCSFFLWGQTRLNMKLLIAPERWISINGVFSVIHLNPTQTRAIKISVTHDLKALICLLGSIFVISLGRPLALKGFIPVLVSVFNSLWTVINVKPSYMPTTINNVNKLCVYLHVRFQICVLVYAFVHPLWNTQMPLAYNRLKST